MNVFMWFFIVLYIRNEFVDVVFKVNMMFSSGMLLFENKVKNYILKGEKINLFCLKDFYVSIRLLM